MKDGKPRFKWYWFLMPEVLWGVTATALCANRLLARDSSVSHEATGWVLLGFGVVICAFILLLVLRRIAVFPPPVFRILWALYGIGATVCFFLLGASRSASQGQPLF